MKTVLLWAGVSSFIIIDFSYSFESKGYPIDWTFIVVDFLFLILSFLFFRWTLSKYLRENLVKIAGVIVVIFVANEMFLYGLIKARLYFGNNELLQFYNYSIGDMVLWKIPFNRKVIWLTLAIQIFYLAFPMIISLISYANKVLFLNQKLKEENLKLELDFLRSQVNPHFLFNTLNNIYGLTVDNEKAAASILKLSDLMRYSLYYAGTEVVPLSQEIKFIKDYLDLESLRLKKENLIQYTQKIENNDLKIRPLILIAFVENTIKHGVHKFKQRDNSVSIDLTVTKDGILLLRCKNSISRGKDENFDFGGVGLENSSKRLNSYYEGKYKLDTIKSYDMYSVELEINLI